MKLLHYKNDTTLLFISGMFAGSWTWERCHEKIIGNHILVEEPLMGISNNIEELIDVIALQLQHIPSPVTVVGNSLGGYIALALAAKVPEKVDQVLISGSAGFNETRADIQDCLSRNKIPQLAEKLISLIFYDRNKMPKEDEAKFIAGLDENLRSLLKLLRECNQIDASHLLKKISCPVHALWGEYDVISPFNNAKEILDKYGVSSTVLSNSGHSPMYESPEAFADWVNQCLTNKTLLTQAA